MVKNKQGRYIKRLDTQKGTTSFFKESIQAKTGLAVLEEVNISTLERKNNTLMSYPSLEELQFNVSRKLMQQPNTYQEISLTELNPYELNVGDTFILHSNTKENGAIYRLEQDSPVSYLLVVVFSPSGYKKNVAVSHSFEGIVNSLTARVACGELSIHTQLKKTS